MSTAEYFTPTNSIVRRIWGQSDTVLLIFAGASAEFALNKAVDWLYFTGKLPSDPIGRLFTTVVYAQKIVFEQNEKALHAIESMNHIHGKVEEARNQKIPQWAYRDVLYMLIDYSIRSFELLERKLSDIEKEEIFQVFYRLGQKMNIEDLPFTHKKWLVDREQHLNEHLALSECSQDLILQYKKHLGSFRFKLLLASYALIAPRQVKEQLKIKERSFLKPLIPLFNLTKTLQIDWFFKRLLFPKKYHRQIKALDFKK